MSGYWQWLEEKDRFSLTEPNNELKEIDEGKEIDEVKKIEVVNKRPENRNIRILFIGLLWGFIVYCGILAVGTWIYRTDILGYRKQFDEKKIGNILFTLVTGRTEKETKMH